MANTLFGPWGTEQADLSQCTVTPTGMAATNLSDVLATTQSANFATIAAFRANAYANYVDGQTFTISYYVTEGDCPQRMYKWVASSTATDDGCLFINPTGNTTSSGRAVLQFVGPVYAMWAGMTSSTTDYSSKLSALYTSISTYYPGTGLSFRGLTTVVLSTAYVWDLCLVPIDLGGATLSYASASSSIVAFTLNNSQGVQQPPISAHIFGPGKIVGPGGTTTSVGLYFNSANTDYAAFIITDNVCISSFGTGHEYNNNAFIIKHNNGIITQCGTPINVLAGNNGGECISYVNCLISNSTNVPTNNNQNGDLFFDGCSIDYCNAGWLNAQLGQIHFTNGHLEGNSPTDQFTSIPLIVGAGQSAAIFISNSTFVCNQSLSASGIGYVASIATNAGSTNPSNGGLVIRDCYLSNLITTTGMFATGGGRFVTEGLTAGWGNGGGFEPYLKSTADNLLQDGGFETVGQLYDPFILADTATITSRLTGTNIKLTQSSTYKQTGTYSLAAAVTASGSAASWGFLVPIEKMKLYSFQSYYANPANLTGTFYVTVCYICANYIPQYGPPSFGMEQVVASVPFVLSNTGSTFEVINTVIAYQLPPEWATHIYVIINQQNVSAGTLYFDNALITGL